MNRFGQGCTAHGLKKLPEGWFGPYVTLQYRLALADNEKEIWAAVFDTLRTVFPALKDFHAWKGETGPSFGWGVEAKGNPAWPRERPNRCEDFALSEWTVSVCLQNPFGNWPMFKRCLGLIDQPLLAALSRVEQSADLQLLSRISSNLLGFLPVEDLYAKAFNSLVERYSGLAGYGTLADVTGRLKVRWAFGAMPPEVLEVDLEPSGGDGVPGGGWLSGWGAPFMDGPFPLSNGFITKGKSAITSFQH